MQQCSILHFIYNLYKNLDQLLQILRSTLAVFEIIVIKLKVGYMTVDNDCEDLVVVLAVKTRRVLLW